MTKEEQVEKVRWEITERIYTIVADELAAFIAEYKMDVRKRRTWDEKPDETKLYWLPYAKEILSHPSIAIVDEDQSLPEMGEFRNGDPYGELNAVYQQIADMAKAKFVRVIKEGKDGQG